ncbi:hypothetical protein ACLKMY_00290 [Paraburkholderia mimosarum]|uniref:hypothetical protein n=1 Tax=Paraburkholderia mimosarum TaxID=312026 RepID=UPI0039C1BE33
MLHGHGEPRDIVRPVHTQPDRTVADVDEALLAVPVEQRGQLVTHHQHERHAGAQPDGDLGRCFSEFGKHIGTLAA